jgi:hypothetical protein
MSDDELAQAQARRIAAAIDAAIEAEGPVAAALELVLASAVANYIAAWPDELRDQQTDALFQLIAKMTAGKLRARAKGEAGEAGGATSH